MFLPWRSVGPRGGEKRGCRWDPASGRWRKAVTEVTFVKGMDNECERGSICEVDMSKYNVGVTLPVHPAW